MIVPMDFSAERTIYRFLEGVFDDNLRREFATKGVRLLGGAITSILSGDSVRDFDFYAEETSVLKQIRKVLEKNNWQLLRESSNAFTFKKDRTVVQLIIHPDFLLSEMSDQLNKFDFTVCQAGIDFSSSKGMWDQRFLLDLAARRLVLNLQAPFPISSLWRLKKYQARGFTISAPELVKLSLMINRLSLTVEELKRQLQGVDVLIIAAFLEKLASMSEGKSADDLLGQWVKVIGETDVIEETV